MSCCGAGVVSRGAPISGNANTLGFYGVGIPHCSAFPCPPMPIHYVTICFQINSGTCLTIQQGCFKGEQIDNVCPVDWSTGVTYDTNGAGYRVVTWQRQVKDKSFIRLRLCACEPCSDPTDCTGSADQACPVSNMLLKFSIDGVDYSQYLQSVSQNGTGVDGCVRAWCIGQRVGGVIPTIDDSCCNPDTWDITDLKRGTEIVMGPIGQAIAPTV